MTLRVAWAGPWNERSAIASFGADVVSALSKAGCLVEVIRTEVGEFVDWPAKPTSVPVHTAAQISPEQLGGHFDCVVVNMGDYYPYHGGAVQILLRAPSCLAILHDASLAGFTDDWRRSAPREFELAQRILDALRPGHTEDSSGLMRIAVLASGAVVHGPHYLEQVRSICSGPVFKLKLAHNFPAIGPKPFHSDRFIVATLGNANPNKRVEEVLKALGCSPRLRQMVLYLVVGAVDPAEKQRLIGLARDFNAPEPHFTGWVPDEVLYSILSGVDAICCLRNPLIEGGSGTLVLSLLSGRPTIVSDHGCYSEVPAGLVMRCPPGNEAPYVLDFLEDIIDRPGDAAAMGRGASEYALEAHHPDRYAAALMTAVEATRRASALNEFAIKFGRDFAEIGIPPDDPAVDRALAGLNDLFSSS